MLPYFFRHYDPFVSRYIIFDDGSDDKTLHLLKSRPNVEIRPFVRVHPASFVLSEQALSNECWKESRGKADWVILTDIDEHLYHVAMSDYLTRCMANRVTIIPALGFQMISRLPPAADVLLSDALPFGAPWSAMMKASIFDPNRIEEINFELGRHRATPLGVVQCPQRDELLLLHYKYIGLELTHTRHLKLRSGLGAIDVENGWGHKYAWSREELLFDWVQVERDAVDIRCLPRQPGDIYPIATWWDAWRPGAHPG